MADQKYTSKKLAFNNAEQFKESFFEPEPATLGYVYLANHTEWTNEDSPDTIADTVADEKSIWDNMFAAKKITGNDVELVLPRVDWTANTKFREYDDTITLDELLSSNTTQNLKPVYMLNSERNVYLCLSNNVSSNSTVEPIGQNLSANGNIATSDGYLWKYMYNIKPSNKFLSNTWIPAPTSTSKLDYDGSSLTSVDGEIAHIIVTDSGTNYYNRFISVASFTTGCTILQLANTSNTSLIANNMVLSGTGIQAGTYITNILPTENKIVVSSRAIANGGGFIWANTRIDVTGDGTGALAVPSLSNNAVSKIIMTNYGKDYTQATVAIYGTGTGATARVVLPPKYGFGYNAAKQLGATNVMVSMRIGEMDSTEGGLISTDTTFRQYGLLRDPYKYGNTSPAYSTTANSVISQTTDITVVSGSDYSLNEFVYQGEETNPTFSGYLHAFTTNVVRLTKVQGTASVGQPLKGTVTNTSGRTVVNVVNPEYQPYTGDILYNENIVKTQRTDGQAENIKFVIRF